MSVYQLKVKMKGAYIAGTSTSTTIGQYVFDSIQSRDNELARHLQTCSNLAISDPFKSFWFANVKASKLAPEVFSRIIVFKTFAYIQSM